MGDPSLRSMIPKRTRNLADRNLFVQPFIAKFLSVPAVVATADLLQVHVLESFYGPLYFWRSLSGKFALGFHQDAAGIAGDREPSPFQLNPR